MSEWGGFQAKIYDENNNLVQTVTDIVEAQGSLAWHEIGGGASLTVPFTGRTLYGLYANGRRVYVTANNQASATGHVIADFIIESCDVDETTLEGGAVAPVLKIAGRDRVKELADIPCRLKCVSKMVESVYAATALTATTLQMHANDASRFAAGALIGWTIQLYDGPEGDNWSEVVGHTAGGLITIDPPWQSNVENDTTPPLNLWRAYGALVTETTGSNTDAKMVMAHAAGAGWLLDAQGYQTTATGTFINPSDASVLKTLQTMAAQSGEYFVRSPGEKKIKWLRQIPPITHPQYGNPLTIVVPLQAYYGNFQLAMIKPGAKYRRETYETVTRVKPTGGGSGDLALTLKDLPTGFTVENKYGLDGEYLYLISAETGGKRVSKDLRFEQISPASDSTASRQTAAAALYRAGLNWLKNHQQVRHVLTCEVISNVPIAPVSYVLVNLAEYDLNNVVMYVVETTVTLKDGAVSYALTLSNKPDPVMSEERLVAAAIRATDTSILYTTAPARNSRRIDKGSGGGGGGETPTDHGALTGLGDDDHPQYLLASGARALAGNLSVNANITIDGVDISAHAANPTAHHALASSGNAAIGVTGQAVSLQLAGPSGLEVAATGLRLNDSVAGDGLSIANKVLSLNLATDSGLQLILDQLRMGTPLSLSTTSTNGVSGAGHGHAVAFTANAKTTPNTLLAGSSLGDLTLRYGIADKVTTPLIDTASGGLRLDPANGVTTNDGNLSFVGARVIDTDTGGLTLAPAQTLVLDPADNVAQIGPTTTLKTAHWASGFLGTGWGVTYDGNADFRKIYADELHVMAFIADTARVAVGAEYITPSMALISRAFTIPAVNATGTLYVEDAPGMGELPVFADNDWLLLRIVDRSGGGLLVANVWGQVSGYTDRADGEQSWTFTCKSTTAAGKTAQRGAIALDFGKAGDGWWWVTTLDPAGAPYAGISTWSGANPYDEGNRKHRLRLGQLRGVSGQYEWGLRAGVATSSYVHFSELRNEIHGTRLSLYAGDGAQLRVSAVDVLFTRVAGTTQTLTPNADHSSVGVITTGANFWSTVDEGTTTPNHNDYITNAANSAGHVFIGLTNPTAFTGNINKVEVKVATRGTGFAADTARLYAQVFASDEATPLTGEVLVISLSGNTTTTTTVLFPQHDASATATAWNGARLRLRWEYEIAVNREAIRLDPSVPSLAVGNPLPTGMTSGGDGFYAGLDDTAGSGYGLRIGRTAGERLEWKSGGALIIYNEADQPWLRVRAGETSLLTGVLRLGSNAGIWQSLTGTFASPGSGYKLYSSAANGGQLDIYGGVLNDPPLSLHSGGLRFQASTGTGTDYFRSRGSDIRWRAQTDTETWMGGVAAKHSATAPGLKLWVNDPAAGVGTITERASVEVGYASGAGFIALNGPVTAGVGVNVAVGLSVGNTAVTPESGALYLQARTTTVTPNATGAMLWAQTVAGVQKLYVKFGNGTVRELATA